MKSCNISFFCAWFISLKIILINIIWFTYWLMLFLCLLQSCLISPLLWKPHVISSHCWLTASKVRLKGKWICWRLKARGEGGPFSLSLSPSFPLLHNTSRESAMQVQPHAHTRSDSLWITPDQWPQWFKQVLATELWLQWLPSPIEDNDWSQLAEVDIQLSLIFF